MIWEAERQLPTEPDIGHTAGSPFTELCLNLENRRAKVNKIQHWVVAGFCVDRKSAARDG